MRVVSSVRSGMGKTLYIKRMAEQLCEHKPSDASICTVIPIHGPVVSSDTIVEYLKEHDSGSLLHLDIAPTVRWVKILLHACLSDINFLLGLQSAGTPSSRHHTVFNANSEKPSKQLGQSVEMLPHTLVCH